MKTEDKNLPVPSVIYEDSDVLVVDKPARINVEKGVGHETEPTIMSWVKDNIDTGRQEPTLVHRLDRETSGALVIAKDSQTKRYLQAQFKHRQVAKTYLALVQGTPDQDEAIIDVPLGRHHSNPLQQAVRPGGKAAITRYKVKQRLDEVTLLEVAPKTGRTHQIRVHLKYIGHPIVGDRLYGRAEPRLKRQWLHASALRLKLPSGATKTFRSPLPAELSEYLNTQTV